MGRRKDDASGGARSVDVDAHASGGPSAAVDRRTLFVRGVAFGATNEELEAAFAAVGPVRSAFLVGGAGSNANAAHAAAADDAAAGSGSASSSSARQQQHKGVGFVQFALPEDADRAVAELDGALLSGRRIRVEHAQKRASFEERKKKKRRGVEEEEEVEGGGDDDEAGEGAEKKAPAPAPAAASARPPRDAAPRDNSNKHRLVRTVAVGNLTPGTARAALDAVRAAAGKEGGASEAIEEIVHPVPEADVERAHLRRDGCGGGVAFVVYASVRAATAAVARLHGSKVSAAEAGDNGTKRRGKGNASAPSPSASTLAPEEAILWARQVSGEGALAKKWRVIIRNLSFSADEAALRAALSPAGFVWELNLPRKPDGRPRGFAFAAFTCRAHAERAIAVANGLEVGGRAVAVDWAVGKAAFVGSAAASENGAAADAAAAAAGENKKEEGAKPEKKKPAAATAAAGADDDEGEDAEVDVAAERALLAKVASQFDDGDEDDDAGDKGKKKEEENGADDDKKKKTKKEKKKEKKASEAAAAAEASAAAAATAASAAPSASSPSPKTPEEKKAAAAARAAAAVEAAAAKLEQSAAVESTVFVRGIPVEATAGELRTRLEGYGDVKAARLVVDKASGRAKGTAFVEFADAAAAARAAAASKAAAAGDGPAITLRGRDLDVALALTQEGARTLAVTRADQGVGDARNLYLAREGRIEQGSDAWKALSPADRAARDRAAADARTKLKSPNFAISRTRLCLRNRPFNVDEATLRPLLLEAVTLRAATASPKLTQVKILSGDGGGGDDGGNGGEGKKKSSNRGKGMAFAEFTDHEHALCALRTLNNSPAPFGVDRRPIVEFAIDDARMMQKRLRAVEAREAAAAGGAGAGTGGAASAGDAADAASRPPSLNRRERKERQSEKESRGKRQRERKRRLAAEAEGGAPSAVEEEEQPRKKKAKGVDGAVVSAQAPATPLPKRARGEATAPDSKPQRQRQQLEEPKPRQQRPPKPVLTKAARRGGGAEKTDKLDELVSQYKARLFGSSGSDGGAGQEGGGKGSKKPVLTKAVQKDRLGEWLA